MRTLFIILIILSLVGCASQSEREEVALNKTCVKKGLSDSDCIKFKDMMEALRVGPCGIPTVLDDEDKIK